MDPPSVRKILARCDEIAALSIRWSSRVAFVRIFERYVTRFAPHKALKLTPWGKLTFDEGRTPPFALTTAALPTAARSCQLQPYLVNCRSILPPPPYPANRRPVLPTVALSCQLTPFPVNRHPFLPTAALSCQLPPCLVVFVEPESLP